MPFDVSVLPIFFAVSFVLLITPGPDVAFIVATGLSEGRRSALWASVGVSLAMFVHSVFAAAGVAAIVSTSPFAFDVIRIGGAAYLARLGLLFQSTLSLASGSLGQWLLSSRRQVFMKRLMGVVFAGLAARLILMERDS